MSFEPNPSSSQPAGRGAPGLLLIFLAVALALGMGLLGFLVGRATAESSVAVVPTLVTPAASPDAPDQVAENSGLAIDTPTPGSSSTPVPPTALPTVPPTATPAPMETLPLTVVVPTSTPAPLDQ